MRKDLRREWWQPALPQIGTEATAVQVATTPSVSRLSFWALLAFTVMLILAPQDHVAALQPLHLALIFALVAGGTYLYDRFSHGSRRLATRWEFLWAGALVLWAVVTVPFSLWPGGSVNKITGIFLKSIIVFWLLGYVVDTPQRLKRVAWLLTLLAIPLSLSAVHTFFSGGFQQQVATQGVQRIAGYTGGLTGNPNDLALVINLIFPLTIGLIFCTRRLPLRLVLAVLAVLDVFAIVATYSRGGFVVLATMLCAYAVCLWRRGAWLIVIILCALVAVAVPVLPGGYASRISTITSVQADPTGSSEHRAQGMRDAAIYALYHPLIGAGIGMSQLTLNRIRNESRGHVVHNVYLEYAMELGWPGLILFLLLLYSVLAASWGARRIAAERPGQENLYFLAEAVGISLIGFVVAAMFYPAAYQFYFYYFAGLAAAAKTVASRIGTTPERELVLAPAAVRRDHD